MLRAHYEADDLLEKGVMAELNGRPQPQLFKNALALFERAAVYAKEAEGSFDELIKIHKSSRMDPTFARALEGILAEHPEVDRVSLTGVRYSNAATAVKKKMRYVSTTTGLSTSKPNYTRLPTDLTQLMIDQKNDLRLVRLQLESTINDFRAVIPTAEKGGFAALMLSGRAGFADKIQQAVDLVETFARYYSKSCMTTIAATMQVYPQGLEWLEK